MNNSFTAVGPPLFAKRSKIRFPKSLTLLSLKKKDPNEKKLSSNWFSLITVPYLLRKRDSRLIQQTPQQKVQFSKELLGQGKITLAPNG